MKKFSLGIIMILLFITTVFSIKANATDLFAPKQEEYRYRTVTSIPTVYGDWKWPGSCSGGTPDIVDRRTTEAGCREVLNSWQQPCIRCGKNGSTTYGEWSDWGNCPPSGCPTANPAMEVEKRTKYPVSIDFDGGIVTTPIFNPIYDLPGQTLELEIPKKDGFTFEYWELIGEGSLTQNTYTFANGIGKIKAIWKINQYPVKISYQSKTYVDGNYDFNSEWRVLDKDNNLHQSFVLKNNGLNEELIPVIYQGYKFLEWNYDESSKIFTPSYTSEKFKVKYLDKDGKVLELQEISWGEDSIPPIPPEVEGYIFKGWDKPTTNIIENTEIKAVYTKEDEKRTFTVTFATEGMEYGSYVVDNQRIYSKNVDDIPMNEKLSIFSLEAQPTEGSKFQGLFYKNKKIKSYETFLITESITIYARFYPDSNDNDIDDRTEAIAVTWETNGGSAIDPTPVGMNSSLKEFPTPKKDGFTFEGWYTSSSFYQAWMMSDKFNKDTTLYAKWSVTPNSSVTVTWETNGGSSIDDTVVVIGSKVIEPENPVKNGFTFEGWYTSSGLSQKWYFSTKVEKDITLYAKWISSASSGSRPSPATTPKPTPTPTPPTAPEKITNPYSGKTFNIRFVNSADEFVEEALLPFGHTILIKNKEGDVLNEYAVRQSLVISLPEEPTYSDLKFSKWSESYDATDFNSYVLQQKYLSSEPINLTDTRSKEPSVEEKSYQFPLGIITISGILVLFASMLIIFVKGRNQK